MKSFRMVRPGGHISVIIELSFFDMLKLLFGRELYLVGQDHFLGEKVILRQTLAYEAFNMSAPKGE